MSDIIGWVIRNASGFIAITLITVPLHRHGFSQLEQLSFVVGVAMVAYDTAYELTHKKGN